MGAQTVAELLTAPQDSASPPLGFTPVDNGPPPPPPGFAPVAQQAPKDSGLLANIAQGASEGVQFNGGLIRDALINPRGIYDRIAGMVGQVMGDKPAPSAPGLGALAAMPADAIARKQSESVVGATPLERIARAAAAGATGGVTNPESAATTVAEMLGGAASGAGSGVAAEVAPDNLKPVAATLGGLVAPAAGHAAAPLAKALEPFAAAGSQKAAESQAARVLTQAATDPQAAAQALEQPAELVPGSKPTTFQQTGDMGLGALERQVATQDPAAFNERAAEQNSARRAALDNVETAGDPNDVAKALKQQFSDLDAQTQAHVDQLTQDAQAKTGAALGPETPADALGANLRDALETANSAAKAREGALWQAVDPNGDMVGNASATIQAAKAIPAEMPKTAKAMAGEEAAVFDAAQNLSPLSPLQDLIALRSRVSAEMRQQNGPEGDAQSLRRLTMLKGAIEDNLSHTISQEIVNEAQKAKAGIIDPSDTTASRLKSWLDEWQAQRQSGSAGGADIPGNPAAPAAGGPGILRAEGAPVEGQGSPAPTQGVPQPALFDQAARERLNAASAATAQRAATFKSGPVKDVLATQGVKGRYRLADGQAAGKFFHPGPSSFQHMQAGLATGAPDFLPTVERYAATTLRRTALKPDGTLDPTKYEGWRKAYGDGLRALPEAVRSKFSTAAMATEALTAAQAERALSLRQAQQGAIGKVMGLSEPQDVVRTVGQVLSGRTAVADMKALARATSSDPVARQGLRRAVTDYMTQKFIGNTETATSGEAQIKSDAYQTFIRTNRATLHLIFSPEEVRSMEAVAEDLQRSARSQNAVKLKGGSNTAQDTLPHLQRMMKMTGRSWMEILGAGIGGTHGPMGAIIGAGAGAAISRVSGALKAAGVERVDSLVSEAMLHPELARELLKKAPRQSANWNTGVNGLTAALWNTTQTKKDEGK